MQFGLVVDSMPCSDNSVVHTTPIQLRMAVLNFIEFLEQHKYYGL